MEKVTDWVGLWRELVEAQARARKIKRENALDLRKAKADRLCARIQRRWAKPDSIREFVVSRLAATPEATVLDIGAGTGAWAASLAQHACQVTAVEMSSVMIEAMQEHLVAEGITNVEIVQGIWPDVLVESHDFTLCSHAMYGSPNLPTFIQRIVQVTRHTCFLVIRVSDTDGVMTKAAMHIWGQPYDSPNFQVAYNALLQMGIYPNVLMGDTSLWTPWADASFEEALGRIKRRFGLGQVSEYDEFLLDLLHKRLTYQDGQYVWPRGVRSGLIYWDVNE